MNIIVYIFFGLIFFNSNAQSTIYGKYIYWDNIKDDLINHPNLKIIDFETGLTWMVTVVNKDVKNSLHADVEPASILDQINFFEFDNHRMHHPQQQVASLHYFQEALTLYLLN